jgi:hypothetical protein
MLRIAAHQFLPNLGVQALPETGEIAGGLYGPLIGGKQTHHHRDRAARYARRRSHAEKILQAGGDPRGLAGFVMDRNPATARELDPLRRDVFD